MTLAGDAQLTGDQFDAHVRALATIRWALRQPALAPWNGFAKFCQAGSLCVVGTMNVSLPDELKSFVEEQVADKGYGTSSEYVRELIRRDRDRQQLRAILLEGARSAPAAPPDAAYFDALRDRIRSAGAPEA
jgi:antitoxin ParD1/3/4